MMGHHDALLVLLTAASFCHLSTSRAINTSGDVDIPNGVAPLRDQDMGPMQKEDVEEEEDELFKDVDPKTLAAVLLEALNHSRAERRGEGEERDGMEGETKAETEEVKEDEGGREVRTKEGADRDRDGRQELELLMAAQQKKREKEEEEERQRAQEEEEKMTEKVTSRTTSQAVQVQERHPASQDGQEDDGQKGPGGHEQGINEEEEEEQLSPEELKNLETMMKEFPRLNAATKRDGDSEQSQRESRGYSSYNDAPSEKKLKWREETQKGLNFPTFRGGNFMDDFENSDAARPQKPTERGATEDDEPRDEEEEEDEEVLSPEEEEAQAKAEQEEMRRQAAEAQRAKMEEEKLADIASDMLLRYMVKQSGGNKKYGLSNAAEDKRSDEEQEATEEDDIDPQTIDKLIEISSKLHLPADDVVDIISDVEKKKKKDVAPEMASPNQNRWPKPQKPLSIQPDLWHKPPKSVWPAYPSYPYRYPSYYQRKQYPDYYPIYLAPPPRPKPRYYVPKPSLALNNFLENSVDDTYSFPPRRRYHGWVQPRMRTPPAVLRQRPYYPGYRYQPVPKLRSPLRAPAIPPQQKYYYSSGPAATTRNEDYYADRKQPESSNRDDLEKYIQQILRKRPLST
ncbi:hypothetical protein EYF80_048441 [Liparis tanakae]|uniref:Neurosecretory protein VGF n=1 Tax=Liparis tanakae TaxID=230148 RepID=A0A4Z2FKW2_9TELE|nr:hypothetical protein EYF80_048441 [Liparis tanakae]